MSLSITKKVQYTPNERLDLGDKLAEDSLLDETLYELIKAIIEDSDDGRIFSGWQTSTVNGPNGGFEIIAEKGFAVSRDGAFLIRDSSTALSAALATNAISYIHAHYDEAASDTDARRFYTGGGEITQNTSTRLTRTSGIIATTTAYGTGVPVFANFQASANIGGVIRQLIPLYAVAVNAGDTITGVYDFRPMFAPDPGVATGNLYGAEGGHSPDLPHDFGPANASTIGITNIRDSLVAIVDRLKQIKNTDNWYNDNFDTAIFNSAGGVYSAVNDSTVSLAGGDSLTSGGKITLYGPTSPISPGQIQYKTNRHSFRNGLGTTVFAQIENTARISLGDITSSSSALGKLHTVSNSDPGVYTDRYANSDEFSFITRRARGSTGAVGNVTNNDMTGGLGFRGNFGGTFYNSAAMQAHVDAGTVSAASMPGRVSIWTSPDGAASPVERFRVSANGRTSVGSPEASDGRLGVYNDDLTDDNAITISGYANTTPGITLSFLRGKTSRAVGASVASGDLLGTIQFKGLYSGTAYAGAYLSAYIDTTPGANDMPTRLAFYTSPNASATPQERMRITMDGLVGINTQSTAPIARLLIVEEGGYTPLSIFGYSNSSPTAAVSEVELVFARARGTRAAPTWLVNNNDLLGRITFRGAAAGAVYDAANISVFVDGAPNMNDMPGRLVFSTSPDGSSTPIERMRITSEGYTTVCTPGWLILSGSTAKTGVLGGNAYIDPTAGTYKYANTDSRGGVGLSLHGLGGENTISAFINTTGGTENVAFTPYEWMRLKVNTYGSGCLHLGNNLTGYENYYDSTYLTAVRATTLTTEDSLLMVATTGATHGVAGLRIRHAGAIWDVCMGDSTQAMSLRFRNSGFEKAVLDSYGGHWANRHYGIEALGTATNQSDLVSRHAHNAVVACGTITFEETLPPIPPYTAGISARHFNISSVTKKTDAYAVKYFEIVLDEAVDTESRIIAQVGARAYTASYPSFLVGSIFAYFQNSTTVRIYCTDFEIASEGYIIRLHLTIIGSPNTVPSFP